MKTITMSPDEWEKVKDNEIQRDTEQHALRFSRAGGHLSAWNPTHDKVAMAELPSGKRVKLDGHSRSFLWKNFPEVLAPPEVLHVDVYPVKTMEETRTLYKFFDSDTSVERAGDKISGAFSLYRFKPRSNRNMWTATGLIASLKILSFPAKWSDSRLLSIYDLVEPWVDTCRRIDSMDPFYKHSIFPSYVMTAMLCTFKAYQEEDDKTDFERSPLAFWQRYHNDEVDRNKQSMDGVYAAMMMTQTFHADRSMHGKGSYGMIRKTAPLYIFCYEQWRNRKRIKSRANLLTDKFRKNVPGLGEWWREHIGEYHYPQIRSAEVIEEE